MVAEQGDIVSRIHAALDRRREPTTVQQYIAIYTKFALSMGNKKRWDRDDVLGYLDKLLEAAYSPAAIIQVYYVLKVVFTKVFDQEFPLTMDDLPNLKGKAVYRPMTDMSDVLNLIFSTKNQENILEWFYLCMSTTYGLRREEMSRLVPDSFSNNNSVVMIHTAKHGQERKHQVPEHLRKWIVPAIARDVLPNSTSWLSGLWHRICQKAEYEGIEREGWHCVPPGNIILTDNGYKNIEDICIGDIVAAHDEWTKVTGTHKHHFIGNLTSIKATGIFNILVTPNHPFLIARGKRTIINDILKMRISNEDDLQWKFGDQIELGEYYKFADYLVTPKSNYGELSNKYIIDISKYVKKFGWARLQHLRNGIVLNERLAYLLGRWVGDGSCSKAAVQIAFNVNDRYGIDLIKDIVEDELGFSCREYQGPGNASRLDFGGEVLGRFLKQELKRNAHDIIIPSYILNSSIGIKISFLKGYLDADGHIAPYSISASSVCRGFILQLQLMLSSINVFASVRTSPSDISRNYIGISRDDALWLWGEESGYSNLDKRSSTKPIIDGEQNFYPRISKIDKIAYNGDVYDIETEAGNYLLNNCVVHNSIRRCLDTELLDAMLPEPVIKNFLRWSPGTSMVFRYYSKNDDKIDQQVFSVHPFVNEWK